MFPLSLPPQLETMGTRAREVLSTEVPTHSLRLGFVVPQDSPPYRFRTRGKLALRPWIGPLYTGTLCSQKQPLEVDRRGPGLTSLESGKKNQEPKPIPASVSEWGSKWPPTFRCKRVPKP